MLRLYDCAGSGNAYKIRLLLTQLGEAFERVELNVINQETRSPAFRARNANHRIPLLEWDDGRRLAESNAILFCLADGTDFLPGDPWQRAQVLQWQNFEQYSHEPNIAVLIFWESAGLNDANAALIPARRAAGIHALEVMEAHLAKNDYFVGDRYSIADISLYAYTHKADQGGFDLGPFPAIRAWIGRIAAQPRHIRITDEVGVAVDWSEVREQPVV